LKFSFGCCINGEEEYPTLGLENKFGDVFLTECCSRDQGETLTKLFSELKLVTDNLLIYG